MEMGEELFNARVGYKRDCDPASDLAADPKRLNTGKTVYEVGMDTSSSSSSVKDVHMADFGRETTTGIRKEEVEECSNKLANNFKEWTEMLGLVGVPESEISTIAFGRASTSLFDTWSHQLEAEHARLKGQDAIPAESISKMIAKCKDEWLDSLFKMERAAKWLAKQENLFTKQILERGYELIFNSLIDFQKTKILSEEDLSLLMNEEIARQLIVGYAISKYTNYGLMTLTGSEL
ncbi:hypothetical protein PCANC_08623 [Puccinia coronata f. sp. avenae]|uniref:Uncharacterized protein n=1 Tax=Puccinia coronata f. sp. avenae TaxID=200324 RepID=A0A2N5UXW5_9BASI|nr:hypothetical protein PCANC_08623 [Puccinia coronata f. sp. avenae]